MFLVDYFDRIAIIHLPGRVDRYRFLRKELALLGVNMDDLKVQIPPAPIAAEADGFASRAVHGNFLSHYEILRGALHDGLKAVWVLEDDAIFSRRLNKTQTAITKVLQDVPWDFCFFGHTLRKPLVDEPKGLVKTAAPFYWAHCYAVHSRVLPSLVTYLEQTLTNPPGHPSGGRLYIDAAFTLFRRQNPEVITLVGNPVLSVQRGSPSSIAAGRWYDRKAWLRPALSVARILRDECWRRTGLTIGGAKPEETIG